MVSVLTAYQIALALATLASLALAYVAWSNRPKRGTRPLAGTMLAASVWLLTTLLSWTSANPETAMFWRRLTYVGITFDVFFLVLFGLEYAGRTDLVRRETVAALLVQPVVANALVWTNDAHGLVWDPATTPGTPATFSYGPAFWGIVAYSYVVVAAVVALLILTVYRSQRFYRSQVVPILVGVSAPAVSNVVFLVTGSPYDLAPLAFTITGIAFTYAVLRQEFLDLGPVARNRIVEEMDDPIFALDDEGRVVDCNPAAERLCGDDDPIGQTTQSLLGVDLLDHRRNGTTSNLTLNRDGRTVHFDVQQSGLADGTHPGSLLVLRDVTDLTERERELDLLKRVTSRFLRHNLRNEMQVVTGSASLIADEADGEVQSQAESIKRTGERVVEMSDKARLVESVVDMEVGRWHHDVTALVCESIARLSTEYPDAQFTADMPDSASVSANPHLGEAIENLLENGVVHNDAADPEVAVVVEHEEDTVTVRVSDDGPGIPETEIEAIRTGDERQLDHGTGIGLFLVKWIVERSRGSVSFEPENSTVILRLPAEPVE